MVTLINAPFAIACECVNNVIKIKHFQTKHYEIIYLQLVMQLAFNVIKSAIKRLDASVRGLRWEDYSCSGGGVYANVCAQVTSPCPSDPKRAVFGAWLNKYFVYNEEDVLSCETETGCFNGTKTPCMPKDQGKLDFSCHDPFNVFT